MSASIFHHSSIYFPLYVSFSSWVQNVQNQVSHWPFLLSTQTQEHSHAGHRCGRPAGRQCAPSSPQTPLPSAAWPWRLRARLPVCVPGRSGGRGPSMRRSTPAAPHACAMQGDSELLPWHTLPPQRGACSFSFS